MKNLFIDRFCLVALLIFGCSSAMLAQNAKQTKPVVMIVGTYHFANPGLDVNNIKADNVLNVKRQKEIADFIQIIKKFKPTRVAVEEPTTNTKLNERYAAYLNGKYELKANEVDQIGFRLAKEMNLKEVAAIDWRGKFDFDKVLASAAANNQTALVEAMMTENKNETAKFEELMRTATITELLTFMNDKRRIEQSHRAYLKFARVGAGNDFAGADLSSDWYARNLKIYANITRLAESKDERIFVIIGSGHLKHLQQFVTDSGEYDLERLSKYL